MDILNLLWSYAVYFTVNVILYRRDWSELRERRVTFVGGGKVGGKSVTDKFDKEPVAREPKGYIEPKKYAVLKPEPVKPELLTIGAKPFDTRSAPPKFKGSSRF